MYTVRSISTCFPRFAHLLLHLALISPTSIPYSENVSREFLFLYFWFFGPSALLLVFVQLTPPQYWLFTYMSLLQRPFPTSQAN